MNLFFNQFINILVALVVTRVLYQRLGEDLYGLINLALSIVLLCSIAVSYGYHLNGPRRIALFRNTPVEKQNLINEIIATRVLIAIVLAGILFWLTYFFDFFQSYTLILYYSLILLLTEALFPMFYFQGNDQLSGFSIANGFAKIAYLLLVILFVSAPVDAPFVNFFFGFSALTVYVVFWIGIYKKENIKWVWVGFDKIYLRLKENFQFFISSIAGHVSIHGGLIVLDSFVSHSELGKYALAQKIAFLLRMIPVFFTQAVLQKAAILFEQDKIKYNVHVKNIFSVGLLMTFGIGVVVAILSKWIVFLLAGEYVAYSQNILQILAFIPFLSMLNFQNMIHILVAEKKQLLTKATWITAVLMLILAAIGSYYYGGYGLSVALVATEIISFIVHTILLSKINDEKS